MKTIIANDPQELIEKVNLAIADKHDLYTSPFVSFEGLLVQRMAPTFGLYEYQLINADNLDDLFRAEENLISLGYDYMFNTIMWYGRYLQWMGRMTDPGLSVRDAVMEISSPHGVVAFEHGKRDEELKLVVGVQEALRLVPRAAGVGYVAKLPYPLSGS